MREGSWTAIAVGTAIVFAAALAAFASATGWNSTLVFALGLIIGVAGLKAARKFRNQSRK